jgi:hypothetical protein
VVVDPALPADVQLAAMDTGPEPGARLSDLAEPINVWRRPAPPFRTVLHSVVACWYVCLMAFFFVLARGTVGLHAVVLLLLGLVPSGTTARLAWQQFRANQAHRSRQWVTQALGHVLYPRDLPERDRQMMKALQWKLRDMAQSKVFLYGLLGRHSDLYPALRGLEWEVCRAVAAGDRATAEGLTSSVNGYAAAVSRAEEAFERWKGWSGPDGPATARSRSESVRDFISHCNKESGPRDLPPVGPGMDDTSRTLIDALGAARKAALAVNRRGS